MEPIKSRASTTPGTNLFNPLWSLTSDPETAAPTLNPPSNDLISFVSGIFLISTIKSGSIKPDFIWTSKSVPPARIFEMPFSPTKILDTSSADDGATYFIIKYPYSETIYQFFYI